MVFLYYVFSVYIYMFISMCHDEIYLCCKLKLVIYLQIMPAVRWLLISSWLCCLAITNIETNSIHENAQIQALDCRNPGRIRNGLVNWMCSNYRTAEKKRESAVVLQYSTKRTVKGYKCTRVQSTFREICGAFSHSKLYEPPSILQPALISEEECSKMAYFHTFVKEDGSVISVEPNRQYEYEFIRHGRLAYSSNNVNCVGSVIMLHGEEVSSLVEMLSVKVLIKEISVETDDGLAVDLDENVKLPPGCNQGRTCQVGYTSYVIEHPEKRCPLSVIREAEFQHVKVNQGGTMVNAIISHPTKTMFSLLKEEAAPTGCSPIFTMFSTEYDHIKVVTRSKSIADTSNVQKHLAPGILDIELEIKITASYQAYQYEVEIQRHLQGLSDKLCVVNSHNIENSELSPFHKNSLIRQRGDVISELACKPVVAQVRIGENRRGKCYSGSLPAWLDNIPILVQAGTHLVLDEQDAEEIQCNTTFLPLFVLTDQSLVGANPVVHYENVTLHHLGKSYLHLDMEGKVEHEDYGSDLLYTREEMESYNNLIHFQRIRKRVMNNLVNDYCTGNPSCGSYQPASEPIVPFNLDNIEDKVASPFSMFFGWMEKVEKIGSYCSIIVVGSLLFSGVYRIGNIFWMVFKNGLNVCQAVKLSLTPTFQKPIPNPPPSSPDAVYKPFLAEGIQLPSITQPPPSVVQPQPLAYFART